MLVSVLVMILQPCLEYLKLRESLSFNQGTLACINFGYKFELKK